MKKLFKNRRKNTKSKQDTVYSRVLKMHRLKQL